MALITEQAIVATAARLVVSQARKSVSEAAQQYIFIASLFLPPGHDGSLLSDDDWKGRKPKKHSMHELEMESSILRSKDRDLRSRRRSTESKLESSTSSGENDMLAQKLEASHAISLTYAVVLNYRTYRLHTCSQKYY